MLRRQRAGDADPVEPGHGDIEKQHVGVQRFREVDRRVTVACGPDKLRSFDSR